ncbi:MAG: hypothetical protein ACP5N1_03955 [Candidatus Woesearchaeota archaeon]
MIRKIKKIFGNQFEMDYHRVKPILDIVLPRIKEEIWQSKNNIKSYFIPPNTKLTISELENITADHYFEYERKLYESSTPKLVEISSIWYKVLREFIQTYGYEQKRMYKRLNNDFGKYFDQDNKLE